MEWTENLLQIPMLAGCIFFIAGLVMCIFPPKKINAIYGYRTSTSMKSEDRWKFAQRYSSVRLIGAGAFLALCSSAGFWIKLNEKNDMILGAVLTFIPIMFIIFSTEKALKHNFPNQ